MARDSWHRDPERHFEGGVFGLSCQQAPVQAEGRVNGMPFYVRPRDAAWTFTVCISRDIEAAAIDPPADEQGFFWMD